MAHSLHFCLQFVFVLHPSAIIAYLLFKLLLHGDHCCICFLSLSPTLSGRCIMHSLRAEILFTDDAQNKIFTLCIVCFGPFASFGRRHGRPSLLLDFIFRFLLLMLTHSFHFKSTMENNSWWNIWLPFDAPTRIFDQKVVNRVSIYLIVSKFAHLRDYAHTDTKSFTDHMMKNG